ncbi:glycosyl hydrolase family 18 family protein [Asticcacaulis biprosthecium C19]|uniref:chitinase n=1 Tax=Asticcacaulis biprosthecium C19 TaxID=715226 RepID=F4QLU8_9CAUL|nr:glycoside hydrolase family 18 protein [Asticcacaulis biprosthecium]EGF92367.1 glycosyl hydrolase family 18 family protein [Asticcacaulis biprosthecium C19]
MAFRTTALTAALLSFVSLTQCNAETPPSPAANAACMPLTAFYPSWRHQAYPVAKLDWTMLDGIATGFVLPRADGSLNTDEVAPYLKDLVTQAHAHNDVVYVSIGGASGYGDAFQQIARDPARRGRFVAEVRQLVETYQLDGVDLDWEYWTWQHSQNKGGRDPDESPLLGVLLKDLRAGLPQSVKLSVDIFAGDWTGAQYTADIQDHVDHVNLMAYDFTGAWASSPVGHHASFDMVQKAVAWAEKNGFKRDKIWLGQPAYGIEFPDGKALSARHVPYNEIAERLKDNADALRKGKSGHLWFDSTDISQRKSTWAAEQGLAGVFFFELTTDVDGENSLVRASRAGLAQRQCAVD